MATTNMKCAANTYADLDKNFEPDYVFEQDNDFYLQSIGAAQQFYLSLVDMRLGFLNFITLGIAGWIQRLATLTFPIVTLILQMDSAKIAKINNDIIVVPADPSKPVTPTPAKPVDPSKPAVPVNPVGPVDPNKKN
jgi:hypothetical protein